MTSILRKHCEEMEKNAKDDIAARGSLLNIEFAHIPEWTFADGVRELAQNFFDQVVKLRSLVQEEFSYAKTKYEKVGNRFEFNAYPTDDKDTQKIQLGYIEVTGRDKKTGLSRIDFVNCFTTLSTKILALGATDKKKSDPLSGGFGEGLKVGINVLLRQPNAEVSYITNGRKWTFKHKQVIGRGLILHVSFSTLDNEAKEKKKFDSKTLARIDCDVEPYLFESILRQSFLCMMPVFQAPFATYTLCRSNLGCWTEMHFFFHPSLRVTRATMLPDVNTDSERQLTGSLFCRGIKVTRDTSFYYGIGINLEDKSVMNRDRNVVHASHAYKAVSQCLPEFLRRHTGQAAMLKFLFDVLQSLPRRGPSRSLHFGSQVVDTVDGFRTVWSGLCDAPMTRDKEWLAAQFFKEFRERFGENCFPCYDEREAAKYKELGIGEGVVVSELLLAFLQTTGVVRSVEHYLEDNLTRAPRLEVSNDARVVLFCNRLLFAALSGPKEYDFLRTGSEYVSVQFVDRPLEPFKAVFVLEPNNRSFRILLGNKLDILSIVEAVSRSNQNVGARASMAVPSVSVAALTTIAESIRNAVSDKYKKLINTPASSVGGYKSSVLSHLIFRMMLRDIEIGQLHEADFYIKKIELGDVPTPVAEPPPPTVPDTLATSVVDDLFVDDVSHGDVAVTPANNSANKMHDDTGTECVTTFVRDGHEYCVLRKPLKRRRVGEDETPTAPVRDNAI